MTDGEKTTSRKGVSDSDRLKFPLGLLTYTEVVIFFFTTVESQNHRITE